jgi:hypothetical protein
MDTTSKEKPDESVKSASDSGSKKSPGSEGALEYPTGLRLVLLAGASILGVFLISLDQVSNYHDRLLVLHH